MVGGPRARSSDVGNGMRTVSRACPVRYTHRTHGNCYTHLCGHRRTHHCAKRISAVGDPSSGGIRRAHRGPGEGGRRTF